MRYDAFPADLFVKNRAKLTFALAPKSIVILSSNDIMPTNADGTMGFKQQTDLFYLTGIDQEETLLILYPDAPEEHLKEILFVKETSELIAIWEGHKLTKKEATEISGIKNVQWAENFDAILKTIMLMNIFETLR
jgi:Xaa-Pro aminopeptidase